MEADSEPKRLPLQRSIFSFASRKMRTDKPSSSGAGIGLRGGCDGRHRCRFPDDLEPEAALDLSL